MRVVVVGEGDRVDALSTALRGDGIAAERLVPGRSDDALSWATWFAHALRRFGERLDGDTPAVLVVADASDTSLAAVLAGAKLLIPVVAARDPRSSADEPWTTNARMIDLLAQTSIAEDPRAISEALRAMGLVPHAE